MKYRIKNWCEYQHYKDRCPPWIKLHHSMITSEMWVMGSDANRALAIACMLLASRNEDNDGSFNGDPEYVKRFAYLNTKPDFNYLIEKNFIEMLQGASTTIANCNTEQSREETEQSRDMSPSDAGRPDCPHQEIINLYHEILPELPAIKRWTDSRKKALQTRWREDEKHQSLDFWRKFFKWLRNFPFYLGDNDRKWKADIDWLLKPANFVKILEKEIE